MMMILMRFQRKRDMSHTFQSIYELSMVSSITHHASSPTHTCTNSEVKLQKKTCCSPNLLRLPHTLSKHTQRGFKEAVVSSCSVKVKCCFSGFIYTTVVRNVSLIRLLHTHTNTSSDIWPFFLNGVWLISHMMEVCL